MYVYVYPICVLANSYEGDPQLKSWHGDHLTSVRIVLYSLVAPKMPKIRPQLLKRPWIVLESETFITFQFALLDISPWSNYNQRNAIHILTTHFSKIDTNIILPCVIFSNLQISEKFYRTKIVKFPTLEMYVQPAWIWVISITQNITWSVWITNFLVLLFSNTLRSMDKLKARSYKSTGKVYFDDVTATCDRTKIWFGQNKLRNSY